MSKWLKFCILAITIGIVIYFVLPHQMWKTNLVKPELEKAEPAILISQTENVSPSPSPKGFNFDSTTDLKSELDKVNPKVVDADFE